MPPIAVATPILMVIAILATVYFFRTGQRKPAIALLVISLLLASITFALLGILMVDHY